MKNAGMRRCYATEGSTPHVCNSCVTLGAKDGVARTSLRLGASACGICTTPARKMHQLEMDTGVLQQRLGHPHTWKTTSTLVEPAVTATLPT